MSVTKLNIADNLTRDLPLQLSQARESVDQVFELMREVMGSNNDLHLSGFGNFTLRDKVARPGRNPRTGEAVEVKSRRVVTFKLGQKLKTALRETVS